MSLPSQLEQVPAEQRLPQAQGIGFGGIGLGAFIVFVGYALTAARNGLKGDAWKFLAGSAVVAVGGIVIEVLRRKKPRVLAVQGNVVGIFEDGQLTRTFTTNQLTLYQLSWVNTFREVMIFGMFGGMATLAALPMLMSPSLMTAWVWGAAISLDALAYSSVLTRVTSKQYYLPGESSPVAFSKSALQRVGWNH